MGREVNFYKTSGGKCPVKEFLDSLPGKAAQKITWVLSLLEDLRIVPSLYFKKLPGTDDIWECRIKPGSNIYRIFAFFSGNEVILTHGIVKKDKEKPREGDKESGEIQTEKGEEGKMSDLKKYIEKRKKKDKAFAVSYDEGYEEFKIGIMLRTVREKARLTQEQLARKLGTQKPAISRIENHAGDIKLSTLEKVAAALGKKLKISIA